MMTISPPICEAYMTPERHDSECIQGCACEADVLEIGGRQIRQDGDNELIWKTEELGIVSTDGI